MIIFIKIVKWMLHCCENKSPSTPTPKPTQ